MERCFVIEKEAALHKKYYDYAALRDKNNEIIKTFVRENIKDTSGYSYISMSDTFGIELTNEEYEKFKNQLKKDYRCLDDGGKLYIFKMNSPIGKKYKALGITVAHKPMAGFELDECYFSIKSRLFDYKDVLYVAILSEELRKDHPMPLGWREISKSEFYAVIDEIEGDKNCE